MDDKKNYLGEGTFSKVYKIRRWHDGQVVAAKVFKQPKSLMSKEN